MSKKTRQTESSKCKIRKLAVQTYTITSDARDALRKSFLGFQSSYSLIPQSLIILKEKS